MYGKYKPVHKRFTRWAKAGVKHLRRIATRYDRRALYFRAALHLASATIWMR